MSVSLGPFALPLDALLLIVSAIIFTVAARTIARRAGTEDGAALADKADKGIMLAIGGSLVIARLAFVVRFWQQYSASPLQILNIRDGGFNAHLGWFVLVIALLFYSYRYKALLRPYVLGSAVAFAVLIPAHIGMTFYKQGMGIPAAPVSALSGESVSLRDFIGKPLVVNYWATWCPPCRREMPVLEAAQRSNPKVEFVFVNQGETVSAVKDYLARHHLELDNVLLDRARTLSQASGAAGLPTTLFFDADGQLVDMKMGEISHAGLRFYLDKQSEQTQQ